MTEHLQGLFWERKAAVLKSGWDKSFQFCWETPPVTKFPLWHLHEMNWLNSVDHAHDKNILPLFCHQGVNCEADRSACPWNTFACQTTSKTLIAKMLPQAQINHFKSASKKQIHDVFFYEYNNWKIVLSIILLQAFIFIPNPFCTDNYGALNAERIQPYHSNTCVREQMAWQN